MKSQVVGSPSFAYVHVDLSPGESIFAESGAMASMSSRMDLKAVLNGSFLSALAKKFLTKESFFISKYTNNTENPMRVTLVQPTPGDIREIDLQDSGIFFQSGAYLAGTAGVKIKAKWAGFRSMIAREGLFRLFANGNGKVWYGGYGGIVDREIDGEYIVDSSHLLAYEPGLKMRIQLAGGFFSSLFGGEGFVIRLIGKGMAQVQTRSLQGLASWLNPKFR